MRKSVAFLIICLLGLNGYSQNKSTEDYTYEMSNPYKVFDARNKFYFSKDNEAITLKFGGANVIIQKFSIDKPSVIKEKKYEAFFPKNYSVETILELNNKHYFFFSSWDGDTEKEQVFSIEIDFTSGEFVGKPKLMFQVEGKVSGSYTAAFSIGDKFKLIPSQDKKSLLIQYTKKVLIKDKAKYSDVVGFYRYDADLNKISGNEITMPYKRIREENLDYMLDNAGNIYMLAKVFHDDSNEDIKKNEEVPNYHVELFLIRSGSTDIAISKIDNKDKFPSELQLCGTDKDFIVCTGYYSDRGSHYAYNSHTSNIEGFVYFKVKPDGSIHDHVLHEIPRNIFDDYESEDFRKYNEKNKKEGLLLFDNIAISSVTLDKDGGVLLVGEQSYYSSGGQYGTSTYKYDHILIVKIKTNGELAWIKKIPKQQYSSMGTGGMSFQYFTENENHYFVFLDNKKNLDLLPNQETEQYSESGKDEPYLMVVKVDDKDGSSTKKMVMNIKEVNNYELKQFDVDRIFKANDSSFMFEAYKKDKEDVMVKVNLK